MHGGAKGSGAPRGEQNGSYKHGGFTYEAIAERWRIHELIRQLRALAGK